MLRLSATPGLCLPACLALAWEPADDAERRVGGSQGLSPSASRRYTQLIPDDQSRPESARF